MATVRSGEIALSHFLNLMDYTAGCYLQGQEHTEEIIGEVAIVFVYFGMEK